MAARTRTESIQDPDTPVEELDPVELVEVPDDEAEQPPDTWGQDGAGTEEPDEGGDGAEPVDQTPPPADSDESAETTGGAV